MNANQNGTMAEGQSARRVATSDTSGGQTVSGTIEQKVNRLRSKVDDLQGASGAAGVARRTIQLYEEGAGAEVTIVERLEHFLGEPIVQPIELFPPLVPRGRATRPTTSKRGPSGKAVGDDGEPRAAEEDRLAGRPRPTGDPLRDVVFRQLDGMGWEVVVTLRCPFDAFTRGPTPAEQEILLTTVGSLRSAQHRAEVLQQLENIVPVAPPD